METVMPSPPVDFNFDSACTTPYISAPSSPPHFGACFASVPASPTRFHGGAVPFSWEEKPGVPMSRHDFDDSINGEDEDDSDFVFEFSGPLEKAYLSAADELFDSGKIKPLKPSLRPEHGEKPPSSPKYPDKTVKEVRRSPKQSGITGNDANKRGRGRETRSNNPRHKATRSLSPFRASDLVFDRKQTGQENTNNNSVSSSFISTMLSGRWKLKDLLLFRSASEGRASSTEKMKKYAELKNKKKSKEEVYCSFRSTTESEGSGSVSRRRGPVSAHELHYTMNRTISEELRRRTFLPYKQGLLGCLGFNPAVHEMSCRGFASVSMPRS